MLYPVATVHPIGWDQSQCAFKAQCQLSPRKNNQLMSASRHLTGSTVPRMQSIPSPSRSLPITWNPGPSIPNALPKTSNIKHQESRHHFFTSKHATATETFKDAIRSSFPMPSTGDQTSRKVRFTQLHHCHRFDFVTCVSGPLTRSFPFQGCRQGSSNFACLDASTTKFPLPYLIRCKSPTVQPNALRLQVSCSLGSHRSFQWPLSPIRRSSNRAYFAARRRADLVLYPESVRCHYDA